MGRRNRIWPVQLRSVGAMIDAGVVVRVGCARCSTIFDVDLKAIERARGRDASLINASPICKVTRCRGQSFFLASLGMDRPVQTLIEPDVNPLGLDGTLARDLEPPGGPTAPAAEARQKRA